jgi:hypothetical protein
MLKFENLKTFYLSKLSFLGSRSRDQRERTTYLLFSAAGQGPLPAGEKEVRRELRELLK